MQWHFFSLSGKKASFHFCSLVRRIKSLSPKRGWETKKAEVREACTQNECCTFDGKKCIGDIGEILRDYCSPTCPSPGSCEHPEAGRRLFVRSSGQGCGFNGTGNGEGKGEAKGRERQTQVRRNPKLKVQGAEMSLFPAGDNKCPCGRAGHKKGDLKT